MCRTAQTRSLGVDKNERNRNKILSRARIEIQWENIRGLIVSKISTGETAEKTKKVLQSRASGRFDCDKSVWERVYI